MKSLEDLAAIRSQLRPLVAMRNDKPATRIIVKTGGSDDRTVINAFVEAIAAAGLEDTVAILDGQAGTPSVEVCRGAEKTVYTDMTAEKAAKVVAELVK